MSTGNTNPGYYRKALIFWVAFFPALILGWVVVGVYDAYLMKSGNATISEGAWYLSQSPMFVFGLTLLVLGPPLVLAGHFFWQSSQVYKQVQNNEGKS